MKYKHERIYGLDAVKIISSNGINKVSIIILKHTMDNKKQYGLERYLCLIKQVNELLLESYTEK